MPDVIALQEVNQNRTAAPVEAERLEESGFVECREVAGRGAPGLNIPVRGDNHAYRLGQFLRSEGVSYFWTWVPAKIGYGRYDEGTALFCRFPIRGAEWFYSTEARDYENWKTRKVLGICAEIEGKPRRFYSVHMGWWSDGTEPVSSPVGADEGIYGPVCGRRVLADGRFQYASPCERRGI